MVSSSRPFAAYCFGELDKLNKFSLQLGLKEESHVIPNLPIRMSGHDSQNISICKWRRSEGDFRNKNIEALRFQSDFFK